MYWYATFALNSTSQKLKLMFPCASQCPHTSHNTRPTLSYISGMRERILTESAVQPNALVRRGLTQTTAYFPRASKNQRCRAIIGHWSGMSIRWPRPLERWIKGVVHHSLTFPPFPVLIKFTVNRYKWARWFRFTHEHLLFPFLWNSIQIPHFTTFLFLGAAEPRASHIVMRYSHY